MAKKIIALLCFALFNLATSQAQADVFLRKPLVPQVMKGSGISVQQIDTEEVEQNGQMNPVQNHQVRFNSANGICLVHMKNPAPESQVISNTFDVDMMIDASGKSKQRAFISMNVSAPTGSNTVKVIMDAAQQKVIFEQYYGLSLVQTYEEKLELLPGWTYLVEITRDLSDPEHDYFGIFPAGPLTPDVKQHSVTFYRTFKEIGFPSQLRLDSCFYFVGTEDSRATFWRESLKIKK